MANIYPHDPAFDAAAVTPSNTGNVDFRALYIGGAGDVKIDTPEGSTVTLYSTAAGSILPIRCVRVYSTGTTATNIVGLK